MRALAPSYLWLPTSLDVGAQGCTVLGAGAQGVFEQGPGLSGRFFSRPDRRLVFASSRDGASYASFVKLCIGRAPTLLVLKDTKGAIFGGVPLLH